MKKPTRTEIEAEIKALEACKFYVPRLTAFGDNNHRNIDLQIEELRGAIDDTAPEWDDFSDDEQDAIMDAKNWKEGYEKTSPSSGWDAFKKKAKP